MFNKQPPTNPLPGSDTSKVFLKTFLHFKEGFDHLTSHYLLVRGLFDFHQLKELDDAWQQLSADTPTWPVEFFYNQ
jgi:hypothetical protein